MQPFLKFTDVRMQGENYIHCSLFASIHAALNLLSATSSTSQKTFDVTLTVFPMWVVVVDPISHFSASVLG